MSEDAAAAVGTVLSDAAPEDLHWTVVLDRALRGGLLPPSPGARNAVIAALAGLVADGRAVKTSTGTYRAAG